MKAQFTQSGARSPDSNDSKCRIWLNGLGAYLTTEIAGERLETAGPADREVPVSLNPTRGTSNFNQMRNSRIQLVQHTGAIALSPWAPCTCMILLEIVGDLENDGNVRGGLINR